MRSYSICLPVSVLFHLASYPPGLFMVCKSKNVLLFQGCIIFHWKYGPHVIHSSVNRHFSSVVQSCLTLCNPRNRSKTGLPVHHQLPEFTQTHVHWVSDAIQTSYPLSPPSPSTFNLSQHQGLFNWVISSHQVAEILEFQLQHQSFQWTPRTDLLSDGLVGSPCSPRDYQESSLTPQFKSICAQVSL